MDKRPTDYDVAIIGGGPAGTAAALSLRQLRPALRVVIAESSQYDQWRVGESLAPGCLQLLDSLGCGERFRAEGFIESFGTRSSWGNQEPYDNEFLFSFHGNSWQVDRTRLDAMLAECAERAGASVLRGTRLIESGEAEGGVWSLTTRRSMDGARTMSARFVIDATGRSASFAVQQGARRIITDHLAGAFVRYEFGAGCAPPDTRTFVEAAEDGWWYSSVTPGSRVEDSCMVGVVAWMSDSDLIRDRNLSSVDAWRRHLGRSCLTSARFASGAAERAVRVFTAHSHKLTPVAGAGWVAAGDAASTFDPLSSQGILKALRSGKLASFVAIDCLEDRPASRERYEKLIAQEFQQYLAVRTWYYQQEQRWPSSPFWSRRHRQAIAIEQNDLNRVEV